MGGFLPHRVALRRHRRTGRDGDFDQNQRGGASPRGVDRARAGGPRSARLARGRPDYARQTLVGSTSYLEFTFADTAEVCVNAVGALLAYHSSAAGTNAGETSVFNGAAENVVFSGNMGSATLAYKRAVVSAGAGSWTTALLNALVARVGYSTDTSPVPYWDALLLEYDVPVNW